MNRLTNVWMFVLGHVKARDGCQRFWFESWVVVVLTIFVGLARSLARMARWLAQMAKSWAVVVLTMFVGLARSLVRMARSWVVVVLTMFVELARWLARMVRWLARKRDVAHKTDKRFDDETH